MNPTTPTQKPSPALPTRPPLATDGCVHTAFMSLQESQRNTNQYYTVPSFGNPGEQIYYNVTIILAGGFATIGSSGGWWDESAGLYQSTLSTPKEFGPFSVLVGDTGVLIRFNPYYVGSYYRATVCPFQAVPTTMPTQIPPHGNHSSRSPCLLHLILSRLHSLCLFFLLLTKT